MYAGCQHSIYISFMLPIGKSTKCVEPFPSAKFLHYTIVSSPLSHTQSRDFTHEFNLEVVGADYSKCDAARTSNLSISYVGFFTPLFLWEHDGCIYCRVIRWWKKTLRSSQDFNLGLLNAGQMLLPTEPLKLWHWHLTGIQKTQVQILCDVFEFVVRLFPVYLSPNIKLLTRGVNLPSNHGNQHLYTTHNHATMNILLWHVYKGIHYHYNQNDP